MNIPDITHAELLERLSYDPLTGVFTYRIAPNRRIQVGSVVGTYDAYGYRTTRIGYVAVKLHRLAWFYVHGEWPSRLIDHINHNKADNRIANLRQADVLLNAQNRAGPQCNSKTGILGVHLRKGKLRVEIKADGKKRYIGIYASPQEASMAYKTAKRVHHAAVYEV